MDFLYKKTGYGRHVIQRFLNNIAPFDRVIDLGAGSGNDLEIASNICPQATFYGLDCNSEKVNLLNKKGFRATQLNIETTRFPYNDEFFDVVIANQILEHCKDIYWVLAEAHRVLRREGSIIVGVPNLAAAHNRLLLLLGKQPSCINLVSAHVRAFTLPGLKSILTFCGFKTITYKGSHIYGIPIKSVSKVAASIFPTFAASIFVVAQKDPSISYQQIMEACQQRNWASAFKLGGPDQVC